MSWKALITDAGNELSAKTISGGNIKLTHAKAGSGTVSEQDLHLQTELVNVKQKLSIESIKYSNAVNNIEILLDCRGLKEAYDLTQIGIYATDPDAGEILFAIAQTENPKHIPTENEVPFYSIDFNFAFALKNNQNMVATIDQSTFATKEQLSVVDARIDNIIVNAGSTEDNAELIDMRVDVDGKRHSTAGEALRSQLKQKANLTDISSPYQFRGACLSANLPGSGNKINDTYYVTDKKCKFTWNGAAWYQSSLNESDYEEELSSLTEDLDYESTMLKNELDDFVDKSNNLFNKESVSDGFYSGTTGKLSINSAYCCVMIPFTYKDTITITGTNYDQCYYDSNKTFIGSSTLKGKALTIDGSTVSGKNPQTNEKLNNNKIRYIGINIEKNEYDLNKYMICRGESLSNSYIEYGVKKIKKDVKIDYTQVDGIPHVTKVYTVGSDGDYTSFTDCLKNLKDVTDEKIIYVKTGVYDIFEELGGSDYINSLDTSNLNWRDVQPIVPINTKMIGQGNVTLKFTPTAEEIKSKDIAFLFSPLNISYATEIDNIKIECTNCRYAIHFETNGLTEYADGESRFRNLICHKKSGTFGNPQVFGSGVGRRNQWEFESCTFMSDMTNIWTTHTNTSKEDDSCIIIFNDCIFANDIESEVTKKWELVQFISGGAKIGHKCKHNYVRMNNCYIGGKVGLSYQGTETGEKQQFDLTMLKCDTQGVSISEKFGENPYIPKIY